MGLHVFLLLRFSIVYVLSLCDVSAPFVLTDRVMSSVCVHVCTALLLSKSLCFLFLRSFFRPFLSLFLFYYLRCNDHVYVCVCVCVVVAAAAARFVTGHPLHSDIEKKYSTRTHTYE